MREDDMGDARLPSAPAVDAIDAPSPAAHTPGPWLVWSSLYEGMKAAVVNNEGEHLRTIAEVRQSYADAMLIAAAPDLAEALDWLLASIEATDSDRAERLELAKHAARTTLKAALGVVASSSPPQRIERPSDDQARMNTKTESELASPSPAQWPEDVVERMVTGFLSVKECFGVLLTEEIEKGLRAALATLPPPEPDYDFVGAYMSDPEAFKQMDGRMQLYLAKAIAENIGYDLTPQRFRHVPPPEDERVKGLVRALETIDYIVNADTDWPADDVTDVIRSALASYRGGA